MSPIAIFYLLTSLYVSSAFAEDGREKVFELKLKEVKFHNLDIAEDSQTFKDVYLYKLTGKIWDKERVYVVGNDSSKFSERFTITQSITVVTKNKLTIIWTPELIMITADEDPFSFYKRFFTLDDFSERYSVESVFQGTTMLDNASVIQAKEFKSGGCLFVVLDRNNTPLLIFPSMAFELPPKAASDKVVSVLLQIEPETVVGIEFDTPVNASKFHSYLRSFKLPPVKYINMPVDPFVIFRG